METTEIAAPAAMGRIQSVDALRGAIMMLMALDHIRDFVARSAMLFLPTDLSRTTRHLLHPLDYAFLRAGLHADRGEWRIFVDDAR